MSEPTDLDDDWATTDPKYDDQHEPRRCRHGMPIHDCDWCNDEKED
ncbi:hypothetical protein QHI69_29115 [Burkholderia gladioli pv. gladioli]|nr:hypothetical protein [Burkholderia gladioli]MDJ1165970.1 hypothetical protein [Burkholderia gladioli pv. gladioli]